MTAPQFEEVGAAITECRQRFGLSQKALAARSRVGEKTISSYETGIRIGSIKLSHIAAIAGAFGLSVMQFLGVADEIRERRRLSVVRFVETERHFA